ncbi:MAG: hypothetical protein R2774_08460 [Saprospiraceae bacterium]
MNKFRILTNSFLVLGFSLLIFSCGNVENQIPIPDDITETRSIGNSCLEAALPLPTGSCEGGRYTALVEIPMYPGCIFYVSADYYICSDLSWGHTNIFLGDFNIFDHDCEQYNTDAANPTETWELNVNTQIWQQFTNYFLNNFIDATESSLSVEYIILQCNKTCYISIPKGDSGQTIIVPRKINCGDSCCKRTNDYRRDGNGDWELVSQEVSTLTTCPSSIQTECRKNSIAESPCSSIGCRALQTF